MTAALVAQPTLADVLPMIRRGRDIISVPVAAQSRLAFCDCGETFAINPDDPDSLNSWIMAHGVVVIPPLGDGPIL